MWVDSAIRLPWFGDAGVGKLGSLAMPRLYLAFILLVFWGSNLSL